MKRPLALSFVLVIMLLGCQNSGSSPNKPEDEHGNTYSTGATQSNMRGQEIFTARCQFCHGPGGNYRGNNAANLQLSVLDSISIVATIKNGRGTMPMFRSIFNDTDLSQLELYVKTLRKH